MKITETSLPGVLVLTPKIYLDSRGAFCETWNQRGMTDAGLPPNWVQDNFSVSKKNVLRGIHYQVIQPQGKLVRVTAGVVYDAVVDLRRGSPSFGKWWGAELSDANHHMLWVPPGLAHGMLVLSEVADFLYKCTDIYSPPHERTLAWNDPTAGIGWPLPPGVLPKLSAKDQVGKSFADIEKFP